MQNHRKYQPKELSQPKCDTLKKSSSNFHSDQKSQSKYFFGIYPLSRSKLNEKQQQEKSQFEDTAQPEIHNVSHSVTRSSVTTNQRKNKSQSQSMFQASALQRKTTPNQRSAYFKLGMQVDPICYKQDHERGKIQFICIVNYEKFKICIKQDTNCHSQKRLACAHCIIEEHSDHVQNKLTLEQYCDQFDQNFKDFAVSMSDMEDNIETTKFPNLQNEICFGIQQIQEKLHNYLEMLKENLIINVTTLAQAQCTEITENYQINRDLFDRLSILIPKNIFEMTPAELNNSLVILNKQFLQKLNKQVQSYQDFIVNHEQELYLEWKKQEYVLNKKLEQFVELKADLTNFNSQEKKQTSQGTNESPYSSQNNREYKQQMKEEKEGHNVHDLVQQVAQYVLGQANMAENNKKEHKPIVKVNKPSMEQNFVFGDIKCLSKDEKSSPNSAQKQNISNEKQDQNSSKKKQKNHISSKQSPLKCSHQKDPIQCIPIFKCCQQAYFCVFCHDINSNHKALISIPSLRQCLRCHNIFQVNCVNTVDVCCLRGCQLDNK